MHIFVVPNAVNTVCVLDVVAIIRSAQIEAETVLVLIITFSDFHTVGKNYSRLSTCNHILDYSR